MASKRLAEETRFTVGNEDHADLCEMATFTCVAGGCEFPWLIEDGDGEQVPQPAFCPICGRKAQ